MDNAALYRISLALKNKKSRSAVDLKDYIEDLTGAKDEYNTLNSLGHRLLLLEPTRKRLSLLFKPDKPQPFHPSMLNHFQSILREEFDWQGYCENAETLFEVKIALPVPKTDYANLYEQLKNNRNYQGLSEPEIEDLLEKEIPKSMRRFHQISFDRDKDAPPKLTLEEAQQQLETLVGLKQFKQEMATTLTYISAMRDKGLQLKGRALFPYNYLITTDGYGTGLSTVLEIMASVFYHNEVTNLGLHLEEHVDKSRGHIYDHRFDEYGVCAVIDVDYLCEEELDELLDKLHLDYKDQVICLVANNAHKNKKELAKIENTLKQKSIIYRHLHLSAYSETELLAIFRQIALTYGFTIGTKTTNRLRDLICKLQQADRFNGVRTLKQIITRLVFETTGKPSANKATSALLDKLVWEEWAQNQTPDDTGPAAKLNNLIGLSEVKERVSEILAHFIMEKKKAALGLSSSELCMHMIFTGNPGTGKTTVARIIGQILKKEGLLKKGDLIEVSRQDLVGRYVGWTASITEKIINKSLGSVLFIDEAYALDGEHTGDYGREALATLVKKMEDHKDALMVIMAGYSDEMEKMVALNPGLKSRVPHQIHFPDYSAEELYQIFEQLIGQDYQIEQAAEEKLKELFANAASACHRQSGNGRFVRNVVERLKMKQGKRLSTLENPNQEELLQINLEDVLALLEDRDIKTKLDKRKDKTIGFSCT